MIDGTSVLKDPAEAVVAEEHAAAVRARREPELRAARKEACREPVPAS